MARIFPNSPIGQIPPEVAKAFRLLKQLPDKHYFIWHRLTIWDSPGPEFWVINRERASVLIKVSTATKSQALAMVQPSLFQEESGPIGKAEENALQEFFEQAVDASDGSEGLKSQFPSLILFPNISTKEIDAAFKTGTALKSPWIGKEDIKQETFEKAFERHLGPPLSGDEIRMLRKVFTPEVVIPNEFTVCEPIERNTEATLTDFLFDYNQEWALKLELDLEDTAQQAAKDFRVRLINGVAGSGKSLIIVYRAHLLSKHFPNKSILVLTHNKALIGDLEYRYNFLADGNQNVKWYTFQGWCRRHWPNKQKWIKPLREKSRSRLITEIWQDHLADTSISAGMFRDEIDWYKDRLLFSRESYLAADRTGRGFGLNESMRKRMFDAIIKYESQLKMKNQVDWGDVPRKLWEHVNSGNSSIPEYDAILIDEAQFFAPIWFEIIKKILNPSQGHLFIVADPAQGFLKRRQSWLASGLEVRGRTNRLSKSYRTTRKILDFATLLYRARVPDDDEDIVVPDLLDMPVGVVPQIIPLTSSQDEITRVTNEIVELVKRGIPLEHILVLHPKWRGGVGRLLSQIGKKLGSSSVADAKESPRGKHIRVCTLNASAGLESPIVFLAGVKELYEEEQSLRITDEERIELIRDNTRKIYMAITRAGQRLVMTYAGELPDWLKNPLLQLNR